MVHSLRLIKKKMPQHHKLTECLLHLGVSTHQPGESDSTAVPQTLPTEELRTLILALKANKPPTTSAQAVKGNHWQFGPRNKIKQLAVCLSVRPPFWASSQGS